MSTNAETDDNQCQLTSITKIQRSNSHQASSESHVKKRVKTTSTSSRRGHHDECTLLFKDVHVVLSKKEILKGISGLATVGEILAIMGPSGAGKSTLMNTLAGRVPATSGTITLNGDPVSRKVRRKISYVLQADVFFPNLTLRETLTFTTILRLPDKMPYEQKIRRMHEIVDALELNKCLDTRIGGTFETGLSGGERKRASIATELLTNPKLLILDEPTSGLDSAIAYSLMSTMAKYSKRSSKTVLTTIHQPSSQIFHMFSKVLLLIEGEVAYFGQGRKIIEFFSSLGLHCDPLYNPADFILEQVKSDPETVKRIIDGARSLKEQDDWPDALADTSHKRRHKASSGSDDDVTVSSDDDGDNNEGHSNVNYAFTDNSVTLDGFEMQDVERSHFRFQATANEVDVDAFIDDEAKWQTGFMTQYVTLMKRAVAQSRSRYTSPLNLCHVVIMILAGLEWFQLERSETTMNDRLGILFFLIVQEAFFPAQEAVFKIFDDHGVFHRERSSGIYRLSAYYLAILTTEIPFTFVICSLFAIIVYWMTNLTPAVGNFFAFWALLELSAFVAQSYGVFIGVLITNRQFVVPVVTTIIIAFLLLGGFYNSHLAKWLIWMRYFSYITFALAAMSKVEFTHGDLFTCNPPDRTVFPEYCDNGTTIEGYEFVALKNLDFFPLYGDVLVLVGLVIVLRVLAYVLLRYFRRPKA